jgi:O-antigen ligase/Tfp pilus assembly protein PilF
MARTVPKKGHHAVKEVPKDPVKLIHVILLILYGYLTVFTPNMNTYDSNGPKFLALALLNLVAFAFLFSRKEVKSRQGWYFGFFGNAMGMAYTLLLVVSLLSFFKSVNVIESVLVLSKFFTVFSATYLVSVLVMSERRGLLYLAASMTLLLIYESLLVYTDIRDMIDEGTFRHILKVKSGYSNKNILAAALFIKIPFAVWLMLFRQKGWRVLGMTAIPLALLAVFFMSARAFYLGVFALILVLVAWNVMAFLQDKEKNHLWDGVWLVAFLLISLGAFSFVESQWYPKSTPPAPKARTLNMSADQTAGKLAAAAGNGASTEIGKVDSSAVSDDGSDEDSSLSGGELQVDASSALNGGAGMAGHESNSGSREVRETPSRSRTSVAGRLATISGEEDSANKRLTAWKRSLQLLRENPLLGVGLGNWKVAILKIENQVSKDYIYQYKVHNDFLEIPAETGIFGGVLFLSIFLLLFWKYLVLFLKKGSPGAVEWMFLPTLGLFAYSFDAFFNFPHDRPEIQSLFALYAGIGIAWTSLFLAGKNKSEANALDADELALPVPLMTRLLRGKSAGEGEGISVSPAARYGMMVLFLMIQTGAAWVLVQNFQSLKLQRIVKEEIMRKKLTSPAEKFLTGFPAIPNLNGEAEPIAVQKARFLLNEKRYREAITLLKKDHSSPWDSRPEYFLSMAYNELKMPDSSLYYSQKVYEIKPNNFRNISVMANILLQQKRGGEAESMVDGYLERFPTDPDALKYASGFFDRLGKLEKASAVANTAFKHFPQDSVVRKQKTYIDRKVVIALYKETFDQALAAFRGNRHQESVRLLSEILAEKPDYLEVREYRAFSYYNLRDYKRSNEDLQYLMDQGSVRPNILNLRGVNFYSMGNKEEACRSFRAAMEKGDKDGATNYNRLCKPMETRPQFPPPGGLKK